MTMTDKTCIICGRIYKPTAYNQKRCPDCVAAEKHVCVACGNVFTSPARVGYRKLCDSCLVFNREAVARNRLSPQSEESRRKRAESRTKSEWLEHIAIARNSEGFRRISEKNSPVHAHSKIYRMISPQSEIVVIRNLNAWLRENSHIFPNFKQAKKSFVLISRSIREPDGDFRHQYSYLGWRMESAPETPPDIAERAARRKIIDSKREKELEKK